MKKVTKSLIVAAGLCFAVNLLASDPPGQTDGAKPNMDWVKHTQPGEGHKFLENAVGKFTYTMKWWMSPEAKPELSNGTATSKWVLGGRYLQQEIKGKAMGKPFNGLGFTGFDSLKEEYQSTWMDSMSTAIMVTSGAKEGDVIKQAGTASDPMTGTKDKWFRSELKLTSKNEHVYAMFSKDANGKEFQCMEIQYKRTTK